MMLGLKIMAVMGAMLAGLAARWHAELWQQYAPAGLIHSHPLLAIVEPQARSSLTADVAQLTHQVKVALPPRLATAAALIPWVGDGLHILLQGYQYLLSNSERARRESGAFAWRTHILGEQVIVLSGAAGARTFYNYTRTVRDRGMPDHIHTRVFGKNTTNMLADYKLRSSADGTSAHTDAPQCEHARRKRAAVQALMTASPLHSYISVFARVLRDQLRHEAVTPHPVDVFRTISQALAEFSARAWYGVPEPEAELIEWLRETAVLSDESFGMSVVQVPGTLAWRATRSQEQLLDWLQERVEGVRNGSLHLHRTHPNISTPLEAMATYKDSTGALLPARTAAMEVRNFLRPTMIGAYMSAGMVAQITASKDIRRAVQGELQPTVRQQESCTAGCFDTAFVHKLEQAKYTEALANETRRYYQFTPLLGTRVREPGFVVDGWYLPGNTRMFIDILSVHRDPTAWEHPTDFDPTQWMQDKPYHEMVQWGAANHGTGPLEGYRCAGERLMTRMLQTVAALLTSEFTWDSSRPCNVEATLSRIPSTLAEPCHLHNFSRAQQST